VGKVEGAVHKSVLALLRPAIELAMGVARSGESDDPPQPAPPSLRPYLSFSRLPPAALEAARRAVERDEGFRSRVVAATGESDVGEAGRLWLERPEGWEEALAGLAEEADAARAGSGERLGREERRQARRRLLADEVATRFEQRAARAEAELEQIRRESTDLRRSNRSLAGELERTEAQVVSLTEERQLAVRQLKAAEATLVERAQDAKRAREDADRLRRELAAAHQRVAVAEARAAGLPAPRLHDADPDVEAEPGRARRPPLDLARASSTVGDASVAAERLATALGELASLLAPTTPPSNPGGSPSERAGGRSERAAPLRRRRPVRLPRGWVDDTPQAAAHLARLPGALFLVDGYNVSKTAWPELELTAQRLRLVNAVAELRMRMGTHVEVVFDGAEEGRLATRALPESVRITFTPLGIEADDVLLERIDEQPPERCVVVVSSDRRVKDGARERGASVLSSATFLTLLR
jgi:predicted RNA-binding protein with PIN domain